MISSFGNSVSSLHIYRYDDKQNPIESRKESRSCRSHRRGKTGPQWGPFCCSFFRLLRHLQAMVVILPTSITSLSAPAISEKACSPWYRFLILHSWQLHPRGVLYTAESAGCSEIHNKLVCSNSADQFKAPWILQ